MKDQEILKQRKEELIRLTTQFCNEKLDEEHKELTEKLIHRLFELSSRPFESVNVKQWSSGIIYALGKANLLFDKTFEPFISEDELNDYFEADPYMTFRNASFINEQLKLDIFESDHAFIQSRSDNPLKGRVPVDGVYVSLDLFSSHIREKIINMQSEGYHVELRSKE